MLIRNDGTALFIQKFIKKRRLKFQTTIFCRQSINIY